MEVFRCLLALGRGGAGGGRASVLSDNEGGVDSESKRLEGEGEGRNSGEGLGSSMYPFSSSVS